MTNEFDFTTLNDYDKTQFEIEGKKLIKFIGDYTRIKIPDGVTEVMARAFEGKDITELHIPDSVKRVALSAFKGCDKIKKVEMPLCLAKDIETLTKFFGENVAKIDFAFDLGSPIDFDTLSKIQQELGKIHIEEDKKGGIDLDIDFEKEDPILKEVIKRITETRMASASTIQRRFKVGYARASEIIDFLESKNIIGPQEGAKPREVYITADMYRSKFNEEPVSEAEVEEETKPDTSDIGFDKQPDLLKEALRIFIKTGVVGFGTLQRKLRLGYNRAMKFLTFFEEQKFVSTDLGGGRRNVLITKEDFEKLFNETVELTFKLKSKHFEQVCAGQKTAELRIENDILLPLELNDIIYFVCGNKKITAKVIGWSRESDLKNYSQETLDKAGYVGMSEQEIVGELNKYFTKKEMEFCKYVAIFFEVVR